MDVLTFVAPIGASILAWATATGANALLPGAPAEDETMTLTLGTVDPATGPMANTLIPFEAAELTSLPSALARLGSSWVAVLSRAETSLPSSGTSVQAEGKVKENPGSWAR